MFKKLHNSHLFSVALTLFIFVLNTHAQISDTIYEDSLCAYTWNDTINECPEVLDCIFPNLWNDTTIQVPKNITHISKDGLKLCLENLQLVAPADIIYIMDMSGSMQSTGDPFNVRDDALEAGFTYQINNFPESKAGYVGFGTNLATLAYYPGLSGDHLLPPTNVFTGQAQLQNMVNIIRADINFSCRWTDYNKALAKAIEWLDDPILCPHNYKAIIFISDGKPETGSGNPYPQPAQVSFLQNNNIPVHGIFLGDNIGIDLQNLSTQTGGTSWLVPATSTDTLATVIEQIIAIIQKDFEPKGITVTNLNTGSSANAITSLWNLEFDSVWTGPMSKPVGLKPDLNEIQLSAHFQTTDGLEDTTLTFKFFIDVGGEDDYTSECFFCWYRTQIKVFANNVEVDTLTWENNQYTIKLYHYGVDTIDQIDVVVKTTQKGDYEIVTMTDWTYDGEKFIYTKTVPFAVLGTSQNATSNNGTTEADYEDLITLFWQHPEEIMDTAYAEVVVSAPPNKMEIHDKSGQPSSASKYATSPDVDTVTAGTLAELYAKVFANDKWLDDYENNPDFSKLITWDVVEATTGLVDLSIGTLTTNNNSHNSFFPIKAYHTVDVTAYLEVSGLGTIKETIRLYIQPGEPKMIVIENTNDINQTQDLNSPCHWSPIEIFGNQTDITAYAILRDSLGNWVSPALQALWSVDDQTVVSVSSGPDDEGKIHKETQPFGQTLVHAVQSPIPEDTAVVITYEYDIDSIRIIRKHLGNDTDISDLTMDTNEDTTLHVIGLRSDNGQWIPVSAKWGIDPFATEQNPPAAATNWFFSPSRPDTGVIFAEFAGHHDTVDYVFTVGPPIEVTFEIITPDSLLIAGRIIEGLVKIKNEDGLVPGIWKYPKSGNDPGGNNEAKYDDILSDGTDDPINPIHPGWAPFAQTEEDSAVFSNKELNLIQWFNGGIDTLNFVLYYAPVNESPHQFKVYLDNLSASTLPFVLKPGPLDTIVLIPDTIPSLQTTDPSFIITAKGYDKYGNKLVNEIFTWSSDSTLIDFQTNAISTSIYIDPKNATITQEGYIHVTGISVTSVSNKVYLKIFGPLPTILNAITRDYSGNGFLDAIDLFFNKPVTFPPNYDPSFIIVQKDLTGNIYFKVDSLGYAPLSNDGKNLRLHLSEEDKSMINQNPPETGWTVYLTIDDCDSIKKIDRLKCEDGAAPVVWDVFKNVQDISDKTKDVVTVTLSENFYNYNGSPFMNAGPKPHLVFHVWENDAPNPTDTMWVNVDSIFTIPKVIEQFNDQVNNYTTFNMLNGQNLHANHFLNLNYNNDYVADNEGNEPNDNNQKVRVRITGDIGPITIGPNPLIPNLIFFNDHINDPIIFINNEDLYKIILQNGGVMITIPLQGIKSLELAMMVFDAIGNLVYSNTSEGDILTTITNAEDLWILNALKSGSEVVDFPLYWHGCTSEGRKSAPGLYKLIVFVDAITLSGEKKKSKHPVTVAVSKVRLE